MAESGNFGFQIRDFGLKKQSMSRLNIGNKPPLRRFEGQGCFLVSAQSQKRFLALQGFILIFEPQISFEKSSPGPGAQFNDFLVRCLDVRQIKFDFKLQLFH